MSKDNNSKGTPVAGRTRNKIQKTSGSTSSSYSLSAASTAPAQTGVDPLATQTNTPSSSGSTPTSYSVANTILSATSLSSSLPTTASVIVGGKTDKSSSSSSSTTTPSRIPEYNRDKAVVPTRNTLSSATTPSRIPRFNRDKAVVPTRNTLSSDDNSPSSTTNIASITGLVASLSLSSTTPVNSSTPSSSSSTPAPAAVRAMQTKYMTRGRSLDDSGRSSSSSSSSSSLSVREKGTEYSDNKEDEDLYMALQDSKREYDKPSNVRSETKVKNTPIIKASKSVVAVFKVDYTDYNFKIIGRGQSVVGQQGDHVTSYGLVERGFIRALRGVNFDSEDLSDLKERRGKIYDFISAIATLDELRRGRLYSSIDEILKEYNKDRFKKSEIKEIEEFVEESKKESKKETKEIYKTISDHMDQEKVANAKSIGSALSRMAELTMTYYNKIPKTAFLKIKDCKAPDNEGSTIRNALNYLDNNSGSVDEYLQALSDLFFYPHISDDKALTKHELDTKNSKISSAKPRNNSKEDFILLTARHLHIAFAAYPELKDKFDLSSKDSIIDKFTQNLINEKWPIFKVKSKEIIKAVKTKFNELQEETAKNLYSQSVGFSSVKSSTESSRRTSKNEVGDDSGHSKDEVSDKSGDSKLSLKNASDNDLLEEFERRGLLDAASKGMLNSNIKNNPILDKYNLLLGLGAIKINLEKRMTTEPLEKDDFLEEIFESTSLISKWSPSFKDSKNFAEPLDNDNSHYPEIIGAVYERIKKFGGETIRQQEFLQILNQEILSEKNYQQIQASKSSSHSI